MEAEPLSREGAEALYAANLPTRRDVRSHVFMEAAAVHGSWYVICVADRNRPSGRVHCRNQAEIDAFMAEWGWGANRKEQS
jgi:hypothetical protein